MFVLKLVLKSFVIKSITFSDYTYKIKLENIEILDSTKDLQGKIVK